MDRWTSNHLECPPQMKISVTKTSTTGFKVGIRFVPAVSVSWLAQVSTRVVDQVGKGLPLVSGANQMSTMPMR